MRVLIVKTSSLGDIVHALGVLSDLRTRFPEAKIDWAVDETWGSILAAHPFIDRVVPFCFKKLKREWKRIFLWKHFEKQVRFLKEQNYDYVFDLQGNTKSALVTALARGKEKVGLGRKSVREWPNLLVTKHRFEVDRNANIRMQNVGVVRQFFKDTTPFSWEGVRFILSPEEKQTLAAILSSTSLQGGTKVMVCPGSAWKNKRLPFTTWISFLQHIAREIGGRFLFIGGTEEEEEFCHTLAKNFPGHSQVSGKLSLPLWQNLMSHLDLLIGVDSSALHLCSTTDTPSFSLFGPTLPEVFKPMGERHFAIQGECPYGKRFLKTCPLLRSCSTGACMQNLDPKALSSLFSRWWRGLSD